MERERDKPAAAADYSSHYTPLHNVPVNTAYTEISRDCMFSCNLSCSSRLPLTVSVDGKGREALWQGQSGERVTELPKRARCARAFLQSVEC